MNGNSIQKYVITSAVEQMNDKNRYSVYINNIYHCSLSKEIFYKYDLSVGEIVDIQKLDDAVFEDKFKRAYLSCLNMVSYRPRSIKEIRTYLKRKKYSNSIVESVIEKLIKENYLDDYKFAVDWVKDRIKFRLYSRYRVISELKEKGIERGKIDEIIKEYYPLSKEEEIAEIKIKKYANSRNLSLPNDKDKVAKYLSRSGFSVDSILKILNKFN